MITFDTWLMELWLEPAIRYTVGFTVLGFVWYWLFWAIFESKDRQAVIEASERWAANKKRRSLRAESAELWDSVNQLKRGKKQQRHTYTDKSEG